MFHVYDVIFLTCVTSMMIRGLLAARSAARARYAQLRHASAAALGASWLPTSCPRGGGRGAKGPSAATGLWGSPDGGSVRSGGVDSAAGCLHAGRATVKKPSASRRATP